METVEAFKKIKRNVPWKKKIIWALLQLFKLEIWMGFLSTRNLGCAQQTFFRVGTRDLVKARINGQSYRKAELGSQYPPSRITE